MLLTEMFVSKKIKCEFLIFLYLQFLNLCEWANFLILLHQKTKFWSKKTPDFFAQEDRMMSVGSNFLGVLHMEPTPSPSTSIHLSLTPPLRVGVINGWPHNGDLSCLEYKYRY